jgi:hypothetical protein
MDFLRKHGERAPLCALSLPVKTFTRGLDVSKSSLGFLMKSFHTHLRRQKHSPHSVRSSGKSTKSSWASYRMIRTKSSCLWS